MQNRPLFIKRRHIHHRVTTHRNRDVWIWLDTDTYFIWHLSNVYYVPKTHARVFTWGLQSWWGRSRYPHFTVNILWLQSLNNYITIFAAIKWKRWDSKASIFDSIEQALKILCFTVVHENNQGRGCVGKHWGPWGDQHSMQQKECLPKYLIMTHNKQHISYHDLIHTEYSCLCINN